MLKDDYDVNNGPDALWRKEVSFWSPLLPVATDRERSLRTWTFALPGGTLCVVIATIGGIIIMQKPWLIAIVFAAIFPTIWGILIIAQQLSNAYMDGHQHLKKIGYRMCPGCSYDLSTLEGEPMKCPECGRVTTDAERRAIWESVYDRLESPRNG